MSAQILSTGWYSQADKVNYNAYGDDVLRKSDFRPLWWHSVNSYIKPELVFIVDSASPIKSNDNEIVNINIQELTLNINPGHSQNTPYHYSGWLCSVLHGLEYTLSNDADYFLYVEQDALVYGDEFIAKIENLLHRNKFVFGSASGWPLQQSVFAIRKDGIREFLSAIHNISYSDRDISPELKFCLATCDSYLLSNASKMMLMVNRQLAIKLLIRLFGRINNYAYLPFGYGRIRPINFNDNCFYFQHGNKEELDNYMKLSAYAV